MTPPSPTRRQLRKPERLCRPLPPTGRGPLHLFPWVRRETPPWTLSFSRAYQQLEAVKALLLEYTSMLLEQNPAAAGSCLQRQNFEGELANLAEKYGAPRAAST